MEVSGVHKKKKSEIIFAMIHFTLLQVATSETTIQQQGMAVTVIMRVKSQKTAQFQLIILKSYYAPEVVLPENPYLNVRQMS